MELQVPLRHPQAPPQAPQAPLRVPRPRPAPRRRPREAPPLWASVGLVGLAGLGARLGGRRGRVLRRARLNLLEKSPAVERIRRGDLTEFEAGVSTGWRKLDHFFRPVRGEVVTVSGQPGSGKSEFLLSLAMNLAELHSWKTGLCLFEHKLVQLHLQLLEKKKRDTFENLRRQRINLSEDEDSKWLNEMFPPLGDFSEELRLETILECAEAIVENGQLEALIIDPYNYLEKPAGVGVTVMETDLVSKYMTQLQQFAKKHQVCVFIVVHPTKQSQITGGPPSPYDMQGSAHWYNKCDKALTLLRNKDPNQGSTTPVEIYVGKVRNGSSGRVGKCMLNFEASTRSYYEV